MNLHSKFDRVVEENGNPVIHVTCMCGSPGWKSKCYSVAEAQRYYSASNLVMCLKYAMKYLSATCNI